MRYVRNNPANPSKGQGPKTDKNDQNTYSSINKLMIEQKLYSDPGITIEKVAEIDGGLEKVAQTISEVTNLQETRKVIQQSLDLLQQEIDVADSELVGLVDNTYLM